MKLHLQTGVVLLVTGSGPGWIRVNADEYRENLVLTPVCKWSFMIGG